MRFLYKLTAALMLLIALSPFVMSETVVLRAGQSKMISGKNISLIAAYFEYVTVNVDGVQRDINVFLVQNATETRFNSLTVNVNGVNITVNDVFESQKMAELIIQIGFVCGDNICSSAETSTICCKDCNCSTGYACVDNQCIESKLNKCSNALECNDNNACTTDLCEGLPRKCYNIEISMCIENDNCCPEKCYYENDSDCSRNKTKFECFSSRECIDADSCTIDYCEDGKCEHEKQDGCEFNSTCVSINSTEKINGVESYCTAEGWQKQEKPSKEKENAQENLQEKKRNKILFISIAIILLIIAVFLFLKSHRK